MTSPTNPGDPDIVGLRLKQSAAVELYDALQTARLALIAVADSAAEAGFDRLADIIDTVMGQANAALAKAEGNPS